MKKLFLTFYLISLSCFAEEIPSELLKELISKEYKARLIAQKKIPKWIGEGDNQKQKIQAVLSKIRDTQNFQIRYSLQEQIKSYIIKNSHMGYLGISHSLYLLKTSDTSHPSIRISRVAEETPAKKIGLQIGDLIIEVNDAALKKATPQQTEKGLSYTEHFSYLIKKTPVNENLKLKIYRDGRFMTLNGKVGSYSEFLAKFPQTNEPLDEEGYNRTQNVFYNYWWEENYIDKLKKK